MNFSKFSQYIVLSIFLIAIYSHMWYIMIQQMTMYCISLAENEGGYHHVCDYER